MSAWAGVRRNRANTANWQGLERLERRLKAIPEAVAREIATEMGLVADGVVAALKRGYADDAELQRSVGWTAGEVSGPSGVLGKGRKARTEADHIQSRRNVLLGEKGFRLQVHAGDAKAFWARWREFGTRPHVIKPKEPGGVLRFAKHGRVYATDVVNHPGARARPVFYPVIRAVRKRAKSRVMRAMRKAAKRAAATA